MHTVAYTCTRLLVCSRVCVRTRTHTHTQVHTVTHKKTNIKNNVNHIQEIKSPLAQTLLPRHSTGAEILKTDLQLCLDGKSKVPHHLLELVIAMCRVALGQLHGPLQELLKAWP